MSVAARSIQEVDICTRRPLAHRAVGNSVDHALSYPYDYTNANDIRHRLAD